MIRRLVQRTYRMVSINIHRFLLPLLTLTFLQLPAASAFSNTADTSTTSTSTTTKSASIFVGGLSQECTKQLLQQTFIPYGTISDISMVGFDDSTRKGKRKPFAFVTFDSQQSALAAISDATNGSILQPLENNIFQQVKSAQPLDASKRKRSNDSRKQKENHFEERKNIFSRTNLILQVQSTHVDRLSDYLNYAIKTKFPNLRFHLLGSEKADTPLFEKARSTSFSSRYSPPSIHACKG